MKEEDVIRKIKNKERFTEEEIHDVVWDFPEVWEEEFEEHRWTKDVSTVVKVGECFVRIDWQRGLTESQENEYYEQPYFVKQHKYTKTIEVEEWEAIDE